MDVASKKQIKILRPLDIAVMKIIAISQRGRKRDFLERLKTQYPTVAHDYHHILKSLVYFNDAESDPDPENYFKASWKDVKNYFEKEILNITNKIIIKK